MGGTIASTILTLLVVPLVYYLTERKNYPAQNEPEVVEGKEVAVEETDTDATDSEEQ